MSLTGKGGGGQQQPSVLEEKMSSIATEQWGRFKQVFKPLENQFIDEIKEFGSDESKALDRGRSAATVTDNAPGPRPAVGQSQQGGSAYADTREYSSAVGKGLSRAKNTAEFSADSRKLTGTMDMINKGRGIQSAAAGNLSRAAGLKASEDSSVLDARRQKDANTMQGLGMIGGLAAGAYKGGAFDGWFDTGMKQTEWSGVAMNPNQYAGYA